MPPCPNNRMAETCLHLAAPLRGQALPSGAAALSPPAAGAQGGDAPSSGSTKALLDVGWYLQCPHISRYNLGCERSRQCVSVPILCRARAHPPCKPPGQQRVCSSACYEGTKTLQFLTCKAIPFFICLLPQSLPPVVMVFSSQSQLLAPALHVGLLFVFSCFSSPSSHQHAKPSTSCSSPKRLPPPRSPQVPSACV